LQTEFKWEKCAQQSVEPELGGELELQFAPPDASPGLVNQAG